MFKSYSIISCNVAGFRTQTRMETTLKYFSDSKADFCLLQETHLCYKSLDKLKENWEGEVIISPGTSQQSGIWILARGNSPDIGDIKTDKNGRFALFKIKENKDVILSIYAPSGNSKEKRLERKSFFKQLTNFLRKNVKRSENIILAGDFNNTLSKKDRFSEKNLKCEMNSKISFKSLT